VRGQARTSNGEDLDDHDPALAGHRVHRVNYRATTSSEASDLEEIQANASAAELLMPADQVRAETRCLAARGEDDDEVLRKLTETFDVSSQAMEYRLINLGSGAPSSRQAAETSHTN
jgi:Zn-dependent peptidase ImmA (M78 family)